MPQRILLLAAAGLLVLSGCSKQAAKDAAEPPVPVQVTAVTQETIRRTVEGDGVLFPQDQAGVVPKVSAVVTMGERMALNE